MPFPHDMNPDDPTDRMKVAFTAFIAKLIVDADGVVDFGELRLMTQVFPDPLLEQMGFIDSQGGFTTRYNEAYAEAIQVLPKAMTLEEKLALITVFHNTAMADGELIQAELLVLREASEVLGITVRELSQHLDTLRPPRS